MGRYLYRNDNMKRKLKIKISQLMKILETEETKLPITIIMSGIDKEELKELVKLLKTKKDKE